MLLPLGSGQLFICALHGTRKLLLECLQSFGLRTRLPAKKLLHNGLLAGFADLRDALTTGCLQGVHLAHELPEQVVALHAFPDHATHALAVVHTHAAGHLYPQGLCPTSRRLDHGHAKKDHLHRALGGCQGPFRHACNVGITHRLDLVDPMPGIVGEVIKPPEEIPHEADHLHRCLVGRQLREAAKVRLGNGGLLVEVGLRWTELHFR
mmetsp:Transcript_105437/g.251107  ORF Transcript_105437/g.251107 Transcript_105437/m.251107 type:complete len:208 (-) Transcript_105437:2031-2654(-)